MNNNNNNNILMKLNNLMIILLFILGVSEGEISCPTYSEIPFCSCFVLDDQLHIQCSGTDIPALEKSLTILNGPVKIFNVYELETRAAILPNGLTDNVTSPILQFSLSHSSLEDLGERSLRGLSKSLESLSIVGGKLRSIPQTTLSTLRRLKVIDFEGNQIRQLGPYSFHNILLQKINLKGNQLENISEDAFLGLEETLMDIDMSENKLKSFPYFPLRELHVLSSLNLAWNDLNDLSILSSNTLQKYSSSSSIIDWPLLKHLNLNSNYLKKLDSMTFGTMPNLRSLSIHLNSIEKISESALIALSNLESIDLSHNKIYELDSRLFRPTLEILTIDLSNNHLHKIPPGLFTHLKQLRELFLNGNNLLELKGELWIGTNSLHVIHLQQNGLRQIQSGVLNPLENLTELRLAENFLKIIPQDLFLFNKHLTSLSLDGNLLHQIVPGTFNNSKNLKELRLQNNQITTLPKGVLDVLENIEEIYLENNQLNSIEGLDSILNLKHISLSRNCLKIINKSSLPSSDLTSLSLGHNNIQSIYNGAFINQTFLSILYLGNNQLTTLTALTFIGLSNLERLYLSNNNLTLIELDSFTPLINSLQFIDLNANSLSALHSKTFNGLSLLQEINLSHNYLHSLESGTFNNLQNLRILDLSHNQLKQFNTIPSIEILKLSSNVLTQIIIGQNKQPIRMKELDLNQNQFNGTSLQSLHFPYLEILQISFNNLSNINDGFLQGFPSLSYLAMERCFISSLPNDLFRWNSNLALLRLNDNQLSWIPDTIFNSGGEDNPNILPLRELQLKHNRFRNFPYKSLSNLSSLQVLSLSGNRMNHLEISKIKLLKLKQLDLNDNRLTKISGNHLWKSFPNLEVVDLGENNITKIGDEFFKNLTTITQINLGGNELIKIPWALSFLFGSYVLNMSGNPLINFENHHNANVNYSVMDLCLTDTNVSILNGNEFTIYPKLHRLLIKRNPIQILPSGIFQILQSLNVLDLSENDIENIQTDSFYGLLQLKSLNLSHNRIKTLPSFHSNLIGLQDVDLSYNQISTLLKECLMNLGSLSSIRLRGNWITSLPSDLFEFSNRLSILDLSHNFIELVPSSVLGHLETRITTLKLEENPLSCECESREFWEWLQSHPKIFAMSSIGSGEPNFVCERPEELRGRLMLHSDLPSLCSTPAILKLAIQDVKPSSAVVSWQGGNNSGMRGYVIAYHALNHNDVIRTTPLPATSRVYVVPDLESDTPYLICVLGLSNDQNINTSTTTSTTTNNKNTISNKSVASLLRDSPFSKCAQVRTLGEDENERMSLVHRRLGVLVGAVVGAVVFMIFITTLACVKVRNRSRFRQQQQNGKLDHHNLSDVIEATNTVGTLGGYHNESSITNHSLITNQPPPSSSSSSSNNHHHHQHHHHIHHQQPSSADFLTYRHYSLSSDSHPIQSSDIIQRL